MTINNTRDPSVPGHGSANRPYKRNGLYHVPAGYWDGFIANPTAQDWKDSQSVKAYATGYYPRVSFGRAFFGGDPIEFTLQFYNFTNETVITGPSYKWHASDAWVTLENQDENEYYPGTPHAWWHALGGSVELAPGESTFRTFIYHPAESANDYVMDGYEPTSDYAHDLWLKDPDPADWGSSKTPAVEVIAHYSDINKLPDLSPKYSYKLYNESEEWFSMYAFDEDAERDLTVNPTGTAAFTLSADASTGVVIKLSTTYWPNADSHANYVGKSEGFTKLSGDYYCDEDGDVVFPTFFVDGVSFVVNRYFKLSVDVGETIWVNFNLNGVWEIENQKVWESSPGVGLSAYENVVINGPVPNMLAGGGNLVANVVDSVADDNPYGDVWVTWLTPHDGDVVLPAPKISNARLEKDGVAVSSVPFYDESHLTFRYDHAYWTFPEAGLSTASTYFGQTETGLKGYEGHRNQWPSLYGAYRTYIPKISWHNRKLGDGQYSTGDTLQAGQAGPSTGLSQVDTQEYGIGGYFTWVRVGRGSTIYETLPPYTDTELYTDIDANGNQFNGRRSAIAGFTSGSVGCIAVEASTCRYKTYQFAYNNYDQYDHYSHFTYVGASCELTRPILTRAVTQNTDSQSQPIAITKAAKNVAVLNQDGNPTGAINGVQDGDPVQLLYRLTNTGGSTATPISKPTPWHGTGSLFSGTSQASRTALNTYNSMDFITNNVVSPGQTSDSILVWTPRKAGTFTYSYLSGDLNYQWSLATNEIGEDPSEASGTAIVRGNLLDRVSYGFQDFPELGNLYLVEPHGYRSSPYPPADYSFIIVTVEQVSVKKRGGWQIGSIGIG